jgi:hypothetical protein
MVAKINAAPQKEEEEEPEPPELLEEIQRLAWLYKKSNQSREQSSALSHQITREVEEVYN